MIEVGELARLGDAVDQRAGLLGQLGHQLDDALGDVLEVHHQRVELDVGAWSDRAAAATRAVMNGSCCRELEDAGCARRPAG